MASLRDEVIDRIEKLEIMMATILEMLQGSTPKVTNPKLIQKMERDPPPTFSKESGKAEAPKEDSIPLPPFGWKTITRKPRKNNQGDVSKGKPDEKRIPLRLVQKDWSVKVLSRDELVKGSEGVCLTTDEHATEVLPFLGNQNIRLVLITPNKLNEKSVKFECRCFAVNDRLTKVTRWYTNIGSQVVIPSLFENGNDTPKVMLTNTTVKMVLQVVKKYCTTSEWQAATSNPGAALRDWVSEAGATSSLVHSYRPIHKDKLQGGAQWIEQVVVLKASGAKSLMKVSGVKGIFAKRYLGEGQPNASTDWKIIWFGQEMKLKTVLERGQLLGDDFKGLAHGRNGLGVRVPMDSYTSCGKLLLGDAFTPAKDNSSIYEIGKVPVWVSPEDLVLEMITQMAWVTEFVRVNKSYGGYKNFLVRGSTEPPKDCLMVGEDLVLIQPAKPVRGGKYSVSYFAGKVPNSTEKVNKNITAPMAAPSGQQQNSEVIGPIPKRRKSMEFTIAQ